MPEVKSNPSERRLPGAGTGWLHAFLPARTRINTRERLRIFLGAFLAILFTAVFSHYGLLHLHSIQPWLVAPMGATAVLVIALPASPMSQPWPVLAGNSLSALVGVLAVHLAHVFGSVEVTAAIAVAASILLMLAMRCLHPPGGATAMLMVLAGTSDPWFVLNPVMSNSLLMILAAIAFNTMSGRRYPHLQSSPVPLVKNDRDRDIDAVLGGYNQLLDISEDDLKTLLADVQTKERQRTLHDVKCSDVMSTELVTVVFGTSLQEAWTLLRQRGIKALPVVDMSHRIVGIVTLADFIRSADLDLHAGFSLKLKKFIRGTSTTHSSQAEVVGQIMTRHVRVASSHKPLADLLPLFASTGHHHIPIVGETGRLAGMITQSDLVKALGSEINTHVDTPIGALNGVASGH